MIKTVAISSIAATAIFSSLAAAAPIAYTSSYTGNTLPVDAPGTVAEPIWTVTGAGTATVSGGVLSASTVGGGELYWGVGGSNGSPSSAWNAVSSVGTTLDFNIQVTGESVDRTGGDNWKGFSMQLGDTSGFAVVYFGLEQIGLRNQAGTQVIAHDNTDFQTFRIVLKDGKVSLYVQDIETPLFDQVALWASASNELLFGDVTTYASGAYDLDFLAWTNAGAEFSAPPAVPEPAMAGTMLLVAGAMASRRRRA